MKVSRRIRYWREQVLGLSKPELADRLGVTESAVIMWESGRTKYPSLRHIESIAKLAKVSVEEFWGPIGKRAA